MAAVGEKVGSYTLTKKLGEGGMGEVYLAEHRHIERRAAIKVLRAALVEDDELVARFFTEARAASIIRHPGIVEILDCEVDSTSGQAFIVMEFLEGESLEDYLARAGGMGGDAKTAADVLVQIASALGAAHAKGIVHRDLKPANVFLAVAPEGGVRVKVLDFGIAKLVSSSGTSKTRTGSLLGTPIYMSPEQCRGAGQVDHRSDIYSLGCLAFELVGGRPPFLREGAGDLVVAHVSEPPTELSSVEPAVSGALNALVMRMLAKSPADRPQSMDEVIAALKMAVPSATASSTLALSREQLGLSGGGSPVGGATVHLPDVVPARVGSKSSPAVTTFSNTASELSVPPSLRRAPPWRWIAIGASGAALVAIGVLALSGGPVRPSRETTKPETVRAVTPEPEEPPPPPPPSDVEITVTSSPSGAEIYVEGEAGSRGRTPKTISLPPETREATLRLTLDGYTPKSVRVRPDQAKQVPVQLEKEKAANPASSRRRRPAKPTSDDDFMKLND